MIAVQVCNPIDIDADGVEFDVDFLEFTNTQTAHLGMALISCDPRSHPDLRVVAEHVCTWLAGARLHGYHVETLRQASIRIERKHT